MRPVRATLLTLVCSPAFAAAQSPAAFTLQQILSAPYAVSLTAAPSGNRFAWVENAEGRRNLWIGSATEPARMLTHYTEDDGQDIAQLAWSPDASAIAYVHGAESGADGRPANPAHLQRALLLQIIVQPVAAGASPIVVGEGYAPLFTLDGHSLLFTRAGQVWIADLAAIQLCSSSKNCHPERTEGPAAPPTPFAHQLVYDRGSATQLTPSPDGNSLAFVSRRKGHSFIALFNLATHELRFLAPSTGVDFAPTFSPDGRQLAWLRRPFTEPAEYMPQRTSPNPWSIQVSDLATGTTRNVFTPEPNQPGSALPHLATGEPRLFFAAGNRILFFSEADGWVHLYSLDPATKAVPLLLTAGDGEVEDVSLSADRKEVFWASNIRMNMFSYDGFASCMGPVRSLETADIERRHISSVDVTKRLAMKASKSNPLTDVLAGDLARKTAGQGIETHPVPLADGSLVALASNSFAPMHPAYVAKDGSLTDLRGQWLPKTYPQEALVFPEEVSSPFPDGSSAGGTKASRTGSARQLLHAQLFLPGNTKARGNDPLPWCNGHKIGQHPKNPEQHAAIIFVHGGPRRQMLLGYPAMDYYSNAYAMNQYLASRGFIVLSVNYRGGIGYGLNFREADNYGPHGASEYNDVLAAVAYLRQRPDVDPKRIGIWGGSYGGYLTALALARNSDLFAAGVDFHGVHEWSLEDNASDWLRGTLPEQEKIAALAHASSPMADVAKWRSPVLFIHGDNDPEVAYAQTPTLADALRARKAPVEELIFPDELHGFLLHKDWLAAYEATAAFFERTLKPQQ